MIAEQTLRLLRRMSLGTMADEYERQMDDQQALALSFDDRLGLMVDIEYSKRQNSRLARLINTAKFTDRNASLEGIIYLPERDLDASLIQRLASCAYIEKNQNIQFLGVTGSGKSFLANALGIAACRNGYSVKYVNLQDLLTSFLVASVDGSMNRLLSELKRVRLLIIDDWLMFDIKDDATASFLFTLIEARKYTGSMIVCSQLDAEGWHGRIANKVAADSICDRLVNSSFKIIVKGEMRRKIARESMLAEA